MIDVPWPNLPEFYTHRIHVWYIYLHGNHKFMPNVGKSSIHGACGIWFRDGPNGNCSNFGCFPGHLEVWTPTNMCWSHSLMTDKHRKLLGEYNLPMPVMFEEELVMMKSCKKIGSWTTLEQGANGIPIFNTNIYTLEISYADQKWVAWKR